MAGMTMIVFEIDGREVMMSDAESIHNAMTNGTVQAGAMVTVYLSDGSKLLKPAAQHKQLAPYFLVTEEPEAEPNLGLSKLTPVEDETPIPAREPAPTPQSTADRLKALEDEIAADPHSAANRTWMPPVTASRAPPTHYDAPDAQQKPFDVRDLGQRPFNASDKNRVVAALLAFFLGGLGVHKFYLGKNQAGAIMLALTLVGFLTSIVLIGLPILFGVGAVAFVECIIYLLTSDEEFDAKYVRGNKEWL
jgi:TM2 domain-containing membrane protein YozV